MNTHNIKIVNEKELESLIESKYINELNKEKIKNTIKLKEPIYKLMYKKGYKLFSLENILKDTKNKQANMLPFILISITIFLFSLINLSLILENSPIAFLDIIKNMFNIEEVLRNKTIGCLMFMFASSLMFLISISIYIKLQLLSFELEKTSKKFNKRNRDSFEVYIDNKIIY